MSSASDTNISNVFSLFAYSKFNVSRLCWCILVFAILWTIWLNRNAVIFRNASFNVASSFFNIFHLALLWTGILLGRQAVATSSATQAIHRMHPEWDSTQVVQITSNETEVVSDEPILISDILDLNSLVPDAANI